MDLPTRAARPAGPHNRWAPSPPFCTTRSTRSSPCRRSPLAAALALHVLKIAAEARSWHGIVAHAYRDARFRVTFGAFTSAIAANVVLPAKIGEALRLGIVRRRVRDSSSSTIAATMVLETRHRDGVQRRLVVVVLLAGRSVGSLGAPLDAVRGRGGPPVHALRRRLGTLASSSSASACPRAAPASRRGATCAAASPSSALPRRSAGPSWPGRCSPGFSGSRPSTSSWLPSTSRRPPGRCSWSWPPRSPPRSCRSYPATPAPSRLRSSSALAGYATAASVVALGVGMQAATSVIDLLLGALAVGLVTSRDRAPPPLGRPAAPPARRDL